MLNQALFEEKHIGKMFMKIAIPGAIGMLASAIYQFIDGIFVNVFLGSTAFAALNFCFPIIIMIYAVSDLIGVGSSVIIAIRMGQKRNSEANSIFSAALILIFIADLIIGFLTFFISRNILSLMGAEGELLDLSCSYLQVYALSLSLTGYIFSLDNYLRISGRVKTSMFVNLFMSISIVAIESLLLGVFKMPLWGAAFSSCLGFSIFAIISFLPFLSKKSSLRLGKPHFDFTEELSIAKSGLSAFLNNIAARITSLIFNVILLEEGGENAVSTYGVLMYIDGFIQPIIYGMSDSLQPCIGYNYGSKKYDRVRKIGKISFITCLVICLVGFIILISIPGPLSLVFISNGSAELKDLSRFALMVFSFTYLTRWISYACQGFFSAIEKPVPAILISLGISLVFPLILIPCFSSLNLLGIWLNFPFASLLTGILCIFLIYVYIYKRKILCDNKQEHIVEINETQE